MQTEKLDFVRLICEGCPTAILPVLWKCRNFPNKAFINSTPYHHQNFRPVKPSAFGQVKEIVYLKENYENYSWKAALITGQMHIIKQIGYQNKTQVATK